MITDEMVEKAAKAIYCNTDWADWVPSFEKSGHQSEYLDSARAALEAVAPMLIARGMEDALAIARRTLVWSADQEAKFVDALRDAKEIDPQMAEQGKLRGEDGRNVARPCREEDSPQPLAEPQRVIRGKARIRRAQDLDPK